MNKFYKFSTLSLLNMMKLHWTILFVVVLCIVGILFLVYQSMAFGKSMPEGALALLSSIVTGIIGYESGQGNQKNKEEVKE
jgi:hypothetical protein